MSLLSQLAADVENVEDELPEVFTFSSVDYPCLVNDLRDTKPIADAGYDPIYDLEITVRIAAFGVVTPPTINNEIIWESRTYRVQERVKSLCGLLYTYKLNRAQ